MYALDHEINDSKISTKFFKTYEEAEKALPKNFTESWADGNGQWFSNWEKFGETTISDLYCIRYAVEMDTR